MWCLVGSVAFTPRIKSCVSRCLKCTNKLSTRVWVRLKRVPCSLLFVATARTVLTLTQSYLCAKSSQSNTRLWDFWSIYFKTLLKMVATWRESKMPFWPNSQKNSKSGLVISTRPLTRILRLSLSISSHQPIPCWQRIQTRTMRCIKICCSTTQSNSSLMHSRQMKRKTKASAMWELSSLAARFSAKLPPHLYPSPLTRRVKHPKKHHEPRQLLKMNLLQSHKKQPKTKRMLKKERKLEVAKLVLPKVERQQ